MSEHGEDKRAPYFVAQTKPYSVLMQCRRCGLVQDLYGVVTDWVTAAVRAGWRDLDAERRADHPISLHGYCPDCFPLRHKPVLRF